MSRMKNHRKVLCVYPAHPVNTVSFNSSGCSLSMRGLDSQYHTGNKPGWFTRLLLLYFNICTHLWINILSFVYFVVKCLVSFVVGFTTCLERWYVLTFGKKCPWPRLWVHAMYQ